MAIELSLHKNLESIFPEVPYRGVVRDMLRALRERRYSYDITVDPFSPRQTEDTDAHVRISLPGDKKGELYLRSRSWWFKMAALIPNYAQAMGYDGGPPPIGTISVEKEIDSIPRKTFTSMINLLRGNHYTLIEVILKRKYSRWTTKRNPDFKSPNEDHTYIRGRREENRKKISSVSISHSRVHLVMEKRSTRELGIAMSFYDKPESEDLLLFEDLVSLV